MKYFLQIIFLLVGVVLLPAGCISHNPLTPVDIDRYWQLSTLPTPADPAAPKKRLAGKLPSHWIIRQNTSLIRSTVSIVRAVDQLKAGTDSIEFSIAPEYANSVKNTLADVRSTLENLSQLTDYEKSADRKKWAQNLSNALINLESSLRYVMLEEKPANAAAQNEPAAFAAQPLLEMISLYLNERAGESLLADLQPEELQQLRTVLVHLTLRIGFDLAGRSLPAPLRSRVLLQLKEAVDPQKQKQALEKLLAQSVEQAPIAASDNQLRALLHATLRWSPKALLVLESFLDQWERVDFIEFSIDMINKKSLITADIHIQPGCEIRMAQIMPFQPNLIFRGHSRIILPPEEPHTGEFSILFESFDHGAVELRFENPIYTFVRWLILPLEDAKFRELRVFTSSSGDSTHLISVTLLLESLHDKKDTRRIIVFQDIQREKTIRDLFSVQTHPLFSQKQFHYLRPDQRFSFQHKTVFDSK